MSARKPAVPRDLSGAEWEIMNIFWRHGELSAREVFEALPRERRWAHNTVKTLLSRLVAKNALAYKQVGNSYLYRPLVERDRLARREVQGLLDRLMGDAAGPVAAYLIERAEFSDAEIEKLRQLLDRKTAGPRTGGKGKKDE